MKNIYFLLLAHFAFFCSAQVGINTNLPQGKFHVDAAKNNTTELTDLQKNDDFVVKSDGKIGLGNTNPAVRLDARSANDSNSAIAIGYTDVKLVQVQFDIITHRVVFYKFQTVLNGALYFLPQQNHL